MIRIGRHVGAEGKHLPFKMAAKTTFGLLYLVKHLIVMLKCAVNITTSSFQDEKFVFRKR